MRDIPLFLNSSIASAVNSGVALGVTLVRKPTLTLYRAIKQIRPLQRIAASQNHQRIAKLFGFFKKAIAFLGGQLAGIPVWLNIGAAVNAG